MIQKPITTALNTSTYVAITLGATQRCSSFGCWTEDGTAFYISDTAAGTVNVKTLPDQAINVDTKTGKGEVLFYAKASTGTPNLATLISI